MKRGSSNYLSAAVAAALLATLATSTLAAAWDDADLDRVLGRYVDDEGFVDYEGLVAHRAPLDRYVEALGRTSPDSDPDRFPTREDRLAYWMNAYNALMLHRVVEAWPIGSVREIRAAYGVFWREKHRLGGEKWTLRGLENKIIRDRFDEPRIHFAINCASRGCPALPRRAWRPETLDADLEAAARRFVADESNVRFDFERRVVELSSIFKWFDKDFTRWLDARGIEPRHGVLTWVVRYLPEPAGGVEWPSADALDDWTVEWIPYDWSVNVSTGAPRDAP
jgi:hypothetical protein